MFTFDNSLSDKSVHSKLFQRGLVVACLKINSLLFHIDELRAFIEGTME